MVSTLFFALFPILPDYTRIAGRPAYVFISIFTTIVFLMNAMAKNRLFVKKDWITLIVLLYSIFITIPVVFTAGVISGVVIVFKYCTPVIITLYTIRNEDGFEHVINILIKVSGFIVLMSFIELIGFNLFSLIENTDLGTMGTNAQIRLGMYRLEGPFGHAISYGIYLTFIAALIQYKLTRNKATKRNKAVLSFLLLCIWIAEMLTLSRAPIVIFIFVQFCIFFLYGTKKKIKKIVKICAISILFISGLLIVGVDVFTKLQTIVDFFETLIANKTSNSIDFGTNSNPYEYRFALVDRVITFMKSTKTSFILGDYLWENSFSVDNGYLSLLIFNGLMGLLSRLGLYLYACLLAFINIFTHKGYQNIKCDFYFIAFFTLVGYLLNLASVAQMNETPILLIFISLVLSRIRIEHRCYKES